LGEIGGPKEGTQRGAFRESGQTKKVKTDPCGKKKKEKSLAWGRGVEKELK